MRKLSLSVLILAAFCLLIGCGYPLHNAARRGDIAEIKKLLDEGANINETMTWLGTPLAFASYDCKVEVIKLLLERGADINNKENPFGYTPLYYASIQGCFDAIKLLIEKGANVDETRVLLKYGKESGFGWDRGQVSREGSLQLLSDVENKIKEAKLAETLKQQKLAEEVALDRQQKIAEVEARAKRQKAEDEESQGQQAEAAGNLREAVNHYVAALQFVAGESAKDQALREKIIKLVAEIKPAPAIPEEARRHYVMAVTLFKEAKDVQGYNGSIEEFREALLAAPWWLEAYRSYGVVSKAAGQYDKAISALKLYMVTGLTEEDARKVQDEIYIIEAKKKVPKEAENAPQAMPQTMATGTATAARTDPFEGRWVVTHAEHAGTPVGNLVGRRVTITRVGDFYTADGPDGHCQIARFRLSGRTLRDTVTPPLDVQQQLLQMPVSTIQAAGAMPCDVTLTLADDNRTIYVSVDSWEITWRGWQKEEFVSKQKYPGADKFTLERK